MSSSFGLGGSEILAILAIGVALAGGLVGAIYLAVRAARATGKG